MKAKKPGTIWGIIWRVFVVGVFATCANDSYVAGNLAGLILYAGLAIVALIFAVRYGIYYFKSNYGSSTPPVKEAIQHAKEVEEARAELAATRADIAKLREQIAQQSAELNRQKNDCAEKTCAEAKTASTAHSANIEASSLQTPIVAEKQNLVSNPKSGDRLKSVEEYLADKRPERNLGRLRTRLFGSTFTNADGSDRQKILREAYGNGKGKHGIVSNEKGEIEVSWEGFCVGTIPKSDIEAVENIVDYVVDAVFDVKREDLNEDCYENEFDDYDDQPRRRKEHDYRYYVDLILLYDKDAAQAGNQTLSNKVNIRNTKINASESILNIDDFCVVDTETTGLDRQNDRLIEIGIIKFENGKQTDSFSSLINPICHIPATVSLVNHIYDDDVADAPEFSTIAEKVADMLRGNVIVGHNPAFDLDFICNHLEANGINETYRYIDTCSYARGLVPGLKNYKLQTLLAHFEIDCGSAHRALDDAKATYQLFEALREIDWEKHEPKPKSAPRHSREDIKNVVPTVKHIDQSNPLFGKNIVFTGEMSLTRHDAAQLAVNCGAQLRQSVSSKTDYLVVGVQDKDIVGEDGMSTKQEKAQQLNETGKANIKVIDEKTFLTLVSTDTISAI